VFRAPKAPVGRSLAEPRRTDATAPAQGALAAALARLAVFTTNAHTTGQNVSCCLPPDVIDHGT
jgi:hypothetical protein